MNFFNFAYNYQYQPHSPVAAKKTNMPSIVRAPTNTDGSSIVENLLGDINTLQSIEGDLVNKLDTSTDSSDRKSIMNHVLGISDIRANLYKTLMDAENNRYSASKISNMLNASSANKGKPNPARPGSDAARRVRAAVLNRLHKNDTLQNKPSVQNVASTRQSEPRDTDARVDSGIASFFANNEHVMYAVLYVLIVIALCIIFIAAIGDYVMVWGAAAIAFGLLTIVLSNVR